MNWTAAQVKADGPALGCLGCEMAAANFAFAGATGTMYTYYDTIGTAIVETATAAVGNTQMYHQVHSGCVAYTQAWCLTGARKARGGGGSKETPASLYLLSPWLS